MLRAVILDDYQSVARRMADWSKLEGRVALDFLPDHLPDESQVSSRLAGYDVVVAMRERTPFPGSTLQRLPRLRLLVTTGARNAAIDLAACERLGVTVCGTGGSGTSTAELTWGLILAALRRLPTELANVRAGGWMTTVGTDLEGKTLGVTGLGRIGGRVAAVGRAFGMRVRAWSEHLGDERATEVGASRVSRDELFRESDVVSIHLVLSERTRGLVGEAELRAMKPTAWLVNTSRGPICDEAALLRACTEGWIAGAAVDVYDREPLPADSPLRRCPNLLATPHIGYVTEETYRQWYADVVEDIAAFADGAPVRVLVAGRAR